MRKSQICLLLALSLSAPTPLLADFSYQETTQITGGSMLSLIKFAGKLSSSARKAGDPVVSSVYLKGNQMARVSPDNISIIDLDQETITNIDPVKKTYTVITFQQMQQALTQAQAQIQQQQAQAAATAPAANPTTPNDVKMNFDVHVKNTGATKQVSGLNTNEAILTMMMVATDQQTSQSGNLAITNDMWLAPDIPGYGELRDFSVRMAQKMGSVFSGSGFDMSKMLSQHPGANQALSDMQTEMQKVQGVPVLQIMRMGTTTNGQPLPAASEAPLPAAPSTPAMPSAGDVAKESAASAISSHLGGLGGFGGFGKKKPAADPPPPAPAPDATAQPTSAVLMETQTQSSGFSSDAVDPSHFQVPQGYTQIQAAQIQPTQNQATPAPSGK